MIYVSSSKLLESSTPCPRPSLALFTWRLPGEPVDLGEIGVTREKNWERPTPYSPAIKISGVKFDNQNPQIAFVNDLEHPGRSPEFW